MTHLLLALVAPHVIIEIETSHQYTLGYMPKDLIGSSIRVLTGPETDTDRLKCAVQDTKENISSEFEVKLYDAQKNARNMKISCESFKSRASESCLLTLHFAEQVHIYQIGLNEEISWVLVKSKCPFKIEAMSNRIRKEFRVERGDVVTGINPTERFLDLVRDAGDGQRTHNILSSAHPSEKNIMISVTCVPVKFQEGTRGLPSHIAIFLSAADQLHGGQGLSHEQPCLPADVGLSYPSTCDKPEEIPTISLLPVDEGPVVRLHPRNRFPNPSPRRASVGAENPLPAKQEVPDYRCGTALNVASFEISGLLPPPAVASRLPALPAKSAPVQAAPACWSSKTNGGVGPTQSPFQAAGAALEASPATSRGAPCPLFHTSSAGAPATGRSRLAPVPLLIDEGYIRRLQRRHRSRPGRRVPPIISAPSPGPARGGAQPLDALDAQRGPVAAVADTAASVFMSAAFSAAALPAVGGNVLGADCRYADCAVAVRGGNAQPTESLPLRCFLDLGGEGDCCCGGDSDDGGGWSGFEQGAGGWPRWSNSDRPALPGRDSDSDTFGGFAKRGVGF